MRGIFFLFRATRATQTAERVERGLRGRGDAALVHGVLAAAAGDTAPSSGPEGDAARADACCALAANAPNSAELTDVVPAGSGMPGGRSGFESTGATTTSATTSTAATGVLAVRRVRWPGSDDLRRSLSC